MKKIRWYGGGLGYSLRRYYVDCFYAHNIERLPAGSLVLDVGGTKIRKRGQFDIEGFALRVIYANFSTDKQPDVQADAGMLPFSDACFDAVICSELLEHVQAPVSVLAEIERVLKPSGQLLLSAPFLYPIHPDPHDYGRYTDSFWQRELEKLGFTVSLIQRQGFYWSVSADFFRAFVFVGIRDTGIVSSLVKRLLSPVVEVYKGIALCWDATESVTSHPVLSNFTTGFGIVATKGAYSNEQIEGALRVPLSVGLHP